MSHVHVHPPHELMEGRESVAPAERRLELISVVVLALATLLTAWCGYQAARWGGEQSQLYARATSTRSAATQASTRAGQLRIDDLVYFNHWLDAHDAGRRRLAALYRERFRPEFRPAVRAWLAQHPFKHPPKIAGPLYMPQYHLADQERADRLNTEASRFYTAGTQAKEKDDRYILATVFFAAVLFFAGISLRLDWRPLKLVVLAMAFALLVGGGIFVVSLPLA